MLTFIWLLRLETGWVLALLQAIFLLLSLLTPPPPVAPQSFWCLASRCFEIILDRNIVCFSNSDGLRKLSAILDPFLPGKEGKEHQRAIAPSPRSVPALNWLTVTPCGHFNPLQQGGFSVSKVKMLGLSALRGKQTEKAVKGFPLTWFSCQKSLIFKFKEAKICLAYLLA